MKLLREYIRTLSTGATKTASDLGVLECFRKLLVDKSVYKSRCVSIIDELESVGKVVRK